MKVKICGLSTDETMNAALDAGADLIGLVFFPKSPRHVPVKRAAELAGSARGRASIVALLVDPDDEIIGEVVREVAPDLLQLHGKETPDRVAAIRARFGCAVMKAIAVETEVDAAKALLYRGLVDHILFDAKMPQGSALPGGNGVAFDWQALSGVKDKVGSWMLSGGLTPENVSTAIALTGAKAVDVSSGVESAPGRKDPARIRAFIDTAKRAGLQP